MPFLRLERPPTWTVREAEWDPARNETWESLCALSNGYLGVRGFPEELFDAGPTRPGIYAAGVFNPGADGIDELVNLTNFLAVTILLAGRPFRMAVGKITQYQRVLGLKRGILQRSMVYTEGGRSTRLEFERFVSMSNLHLIGQSITITPLDWRGEIRVQMWLDVNVSNEDRKHLRLVHAEHMGRDRVLLATQTDASLVRVAHACRCSSWIREGSSIKPRLIGGGDSIGFEFEATLERGQPSVFERLISTHTSGDPDTDSVERGCLEDVRGAEGGAYGVRRRLHVQAWQRRWDRADIQVDGPEEDQQALRFAIFQLIQHSPPHGMPVSIAAKGLTGEGYRGHVFWDTEIFMLPFFVAMDPPAARRLLAYRCSTLKGAQRKARTLGYQGAMFAWESVATGDEACPPFVKDPRTGELVRVLTGELQHHVTADVVYAAFRYVQSSGNAFYQERGFFRLVVLTARFWASRIGWNAVEDCSEIQNVIGPDEYHVGVNNNAYTNYMAAWNLELAAEQVTRLRLVHRRSRLLRELSVTECEVDRWREIAGRLRRPNVSDTGLWEQHQGFFQLHQTDPAALAAATSQMSERERLKALQESQVLKQADVLMLMVMFAEQFPETVRRANWDYYEPRTTHESSLSPSIHSIAASDLGLPEEAYAYFRRTARLDLNDAMGNTRAGLHMAAIGGMWQAVVRGFLGLDLTGDVPRIRPKLPQTWRRVAMQVQHRGRWYNIGSIGKEGWVNSCEEGCRSVGGSDGQISGEQRIPDP